MLFSWEHQKYQNIHPGAHFGTSLGGSWGGRRVPPCSCSTNNIQSKSWLPVLLFYWTAAAEWSTLYNHQADCPLCYSIGQHQKCDRHYTITRLTAHFTVLLYRIDRMIDNILQITRLTDHFTVLLDSIDRIHRMHDRWYAITRLTAHYIILLHNTDKMINNMQSLGWLPTLLLY